ncbi:autotransporter outer membrane beta-barrel domain-containing protein [Pseudomonas chlororaphis]|uniref:autotransporter outer membrane beta-barrel domain-containing protein n=1 Tax=Pseudomonas chlororaphis TaxID=587753 RepID=UPI001E3E4F1C|nr:autotransporter outer membrane beta-barrel domain-containing protein [Pseudomonas chlororaphis]MCB2255484.1 autotransporter outer membrane beta-barrel domain-containing protein [Pseudomonas chlororaphis]
MKMPNPRIPLTLLSALFPTLPIAAVAADYSSLDLSTPAGENRTLLPGDTVTQTGTGTAVTISGTRNTLSGKGIDIRSGSAGTGSGALGVSVASGGSLSLADSHIDALGASYAQALLVRDAGSKALLDNTTLETEGVLSHAAQAINGASIDLTGGSIITRGDRSDGLYAEGQDSTINARDVQINAQGHESNAVYAKDGAHITLDRVRLEASDTSARWGGKGIVTERGTVTATHSSIVSAAGAGIGVNGGSVHFSDGTVDAHTDAVYLTTPSYANGTLPPASSVELRDVRLRSATGFGLNANSDDARASLERVALVTEGNDVAGIWIPGANSVVEARDSSIEATGRNSVGVSNRASVFTLDGGSITTRGANAYGLYTSFSDPSGKSSSATSTLRNVAIETFGDTAAGVISRISGTQVALHDSSVTTHGKGAYGLLANAARLDLDGTRVRTYGAEAPGLRMGNQGAAVSLDRVDLRTSGASSAGLAVYAYAAGVDNRMDIRDSHIETADGAAIAVNGSGFTGEVSDSTLIGGSATGNGLLLDVQAMESTAARDVQLNAQRSYLEGDVRLDSGSASIALRDHSLLSGALLDNAGRSVDRLSLDDSSQWRLRDNSRVAQLDNRGRVSFGPAGSAFKVLDVSGNLSGAGLFEMRTDLGAGLGDLLRIGGTVEGRHQVLVNNSGAEPSADGGALKLIQSDGGPGTFELANRDQLVDAGTYRYALKSNDPTGERPGDWSLFRVGQVPPPDPKPDPKPDPDPDPGITPEPPPGPVTPPVADSLSTAANAAIDTSAASTVQAIWQAEQATLARRLGELRQGQDQGGVWIRGFGERQKLDNRGGRAFAQTVDGLQVGADLALPVDGGRWYVGGMTGTSNVDRRFPGDGKGTADSYHVGAYATWLDDRGWYVDGVLKANRIQQDFKVSATDGQPVKARTQQNAIGLSVEAGRQITFGEGWFVEPQVGGTLLHARGADYRTSNGLQVDAGSGNSKQLRVGSRVGRRYPLPDGSTVQPYVKLGHTQEFDGRSTVRTNGIATRTDLSGGRDELGLGISASLGSRHHLYADYEHVSGSTLDKPWSVSLGYRYAW